MHPESDVPVHTASEPPPDPLFPHLTDRELEVLDLVATGLSNAAIAGRLHLSDKTVRNVVSTVLGKVGARDRAEAILLAREAALGRS